MLRKGEQRSPTEICHVYDINVRCYVKAALRTNNSICVCCTFVNLQTAQKKPAGFGRLAAQYSRSKHRRMAAARNLSRNFSCIKNSVGSIGAHIVRPPP